MNFKKTYTPKKGYTPISKIGECSLKKLEFGIIELDANEKLEYNTEKNEEEFKDNKKRYEETQIFFSEARKQLLTKFEKYLRITN